MNDKIRLETAKQIQPEQLRAVYGDIIGNEACFVLSLIDKTDKAVWRLFNTLAALSDDTQRMAFLQTVRCAYYQKTANAILNELN